MDFIAIDVETANPDLSSICQIGLVQCNNGVIRKEWKSYVDPEDYFDDVNISIHGIDESITNGAPTFPELLDEIYPYFENTVAVCHTHFDRVAMSQAASKYSIDVLQCRWLDSARVARRTWKECAWKGYGLRALCEKIGYTFNHHDALEDARAAAHIIFAACRETGLDIDGWMKRVRQPIDLSSGSATKSITREGNPEGALYGEVLVFTGSLKKTRREAADLASSIGCQVAQSPTKKTTMLVVGDQDISKLAGHQKSAKHRKAEELINKGVPIKILKEKDFIELVKYSKELS
jgi:DNA polymerase-3 subunit epsilon